MRVLLFERISLVTDVIALWVVRKTDQEMPIRADGFPTLARVGKGQALLHEDVRSLFVAGKLVEECVVGAYSFLVVVCIVVEHAFFQQGVGGFWGAGIARSEIVVDSSP